MPSPWFWRDWVLADRRKPSNQPGLLCKIDNTEIFWSTSSLKISHWINFHEHNVKNNSIWNSVSEIATEFWISCITKAWVVFKWACQKALLLKCENREYIYIFIRENILIFTPSCTYNLGRCVPLKVGLPRPVVEENDQINILLSRDHNHSSHYLLPVSL